MILSISISSPVFKNIWYLTEGDVKIGEVIVKEEAQGQEFYVIKNGRAIVTQGYGHKEKVLAAIQTGHCFGEDALIRAW